MTRTCHLLKEPTNYGRRSKMIDPRILLITVVAEESSRTGKSNGRAGFPSETSPLQNEACTLVFGRTESLAVELRTRLFAPAVDPSSIASAAISPVHKTFSATSSASVPLRLRPQTATGTSHLESRAAIVNISRDRPKARARSSPTQLIGCWFSKSNSAD